METKAKAEASSVPEVKQKELLAEIEKLKEELTKLRNISAYKDGDQPLSLENKKAGCPPVSCNLKIRRTLKGHQGKIYDLDWGNEGKTHVLSAAADGKLILWDAYLQTKAHAIPLRSNWVMTCALSPSETFVASGGLDNACTIYNISETMGQYVKNQKPKCVLEQHEGYLSSCKFIGNKRMLTASGDKTCILWDIETAKALKVFDDHTADVTSLAISKENGTFISGGIDKNAILYDYREKKGRVLKFPGHEGDVNSVAYFPGGVAFGTASNDNACRLFDIRCGRQVQRYVSERYHGGPATAIAFSITGNLMFAGYDYQNNACLAWDTRTAKVSQVLSGHQNRVSCMGVSGAGSALCTGSWDGSLRIWAK
eukprot:CAMPEP_0167770068 /NCGR_PEP_ID=MMETSP0110_2-20121227/17694_1 /TAXON_ID=629695 /ORGANISM="Gymnochlora sp., Strain CCMP2014" /LENGTH=368 /DNA_ID=CAMNT_0007659165 /DNA_START=12 /DNA_END=1118 /DNA_ORIENTATION=-